MELITRETVTVKGLEFKVLDSKIIELYAIKSNIIYIGNSYKNETNRRPLLILNRDTYNDLDSIIERYIKKVNKVMKKTIENKYFRKHTKSLMNEVRGNGLWYRSEEVDILLVTEKELDTMYELIENYKVFFYDKLKEKLSKDIFRKTDSDLFECFILDFVLDNLSIEMINNKDSVYNNEKLNNSNGVFEDTPAAVIASYRKGRVKQFRKLRKEMEEHIPF